MQTQQIGPYLVSGRAGYAVVTVIRSRVGRRTAVDTLGEWYGRQAFQRACCWARTYHDAAVRRLEAGLQRVAQSTVEGRKPCSAPSDDGSPSR